MTVRPIAYTYEADYHCPKCAGNRFGTSWETVFIVESARDREGNPIGAVAPWDEWWEPSLVECQTLNCGMCGRELDTYRPLDLIEQDATKEGTEAGIAAASWYFDFGRMSGGQSKVEEVCERVLRGIEDGDPEILDTFPAAPFSGEYADGLSARDFLEAYGMTEDDDAADDILRAFEDAYSMAASDEIERSCLVQMPYDRVRPEGWTS